MARPLPKALPNAIQVADRWHLMENASAAFLGAVRKSMRSIRTAIGAMTVSPELLTRAERLQYEGYQTIRKPCLNRSRLHGLAKGSRCACAPDDNRTISVVAPERPIVDAHHLQRFSWWQGSSPRYAQ
jgi:hypothetical protein